MPNSAAIFIHLASLALLHLNVDYASAMMPWYFCLAVFMLEPLISRAGGGNSSEEFCDQHVRWQKDLDVERTEGIWFAVGYAQHSPDMASEVADIGCATLHITDTTDQIPSNESLDWSAVEQLLWHQRRLGAAAEVHTIHQLSLLWDEDGRIYEFLYRYSNHTRGLWMAPEAPPEMWPSPNFPQRREVIKVLQATPHLLVLNFCHDFGVPRLFSLVFKRYPWRISHRDWRKLRSLLQRHELPLVVREAAVCSGCGTERTFLVILGCFIFERLVMVL